MDKKEKKYLVKCETQRRLYSLEVSACSVPEAIGYAYAHINSDKLFNGVSNGFKVFMFGRSNNPSRMVRIKEVVIL